MARNRQQRDEDSGEYERPTRKKADSGKVILVVVLAAVAGVVLFCGGGTVLFFRAYHKASQQIASEGAQRQAEERRAVEDRKAKALTLDVLNQKLTGKSAQEVREFLGAPDEAPMADYWGQKRPHYYLYHEKAINPHSDKLEDVYVHFDWNGDWSAVLNVNGSPVR